MATISSLAYKIVADTEGFLKGVRLSKTELLAAKQVFKESIDPITAYQAEMQGLGTLLEKGALTLDQYTAARERLGKTHPDAIAAAQAEAAAERQLAADMTAAQSVIDRHASAQQRYADQVRALAGLKGQGLFEGNEAAYRAELERLKEMLPAIQAKRAEEAAATAESRRMAAAIDATAQAIQDRAAPGMRSYREQIHLAKQALDAGKISQVEYTAEKRRLANLLPQVQAKQAAVTQALQAETEAAERAAAVRKRVHDIVAGLTPALHRYRQGVAELHLLQQRKAMSTDLVRQRMAQLTQEYRQAHPIVGGLWRLWYQHPMLTVAAGMLAASRAASAFSSAVRRTLDNIDGLHTSAQRVGVTIDQMYQLSKAARAGDASVDQLAKAMLELQKRGADPNLTPVQQLLSTLDAIRALPSETQKTAAAMDQFSEAGIDLLPILRMNEQAFAAWRQAVEQPVSKPMLAAAQQANEATKLLGFAWEDLWVIIAGSLAPEIVRVSDGLRLWLSDADKLQNLQRTMENLAGVAELLFDGLELGNAVLGQFNAQQQRLVSVVHAVIGGYYKLREAIAWGTGDAAGAKSWASMARAEMAALEQAMKGVEAGVKVTQAAVAGVRSPAAEITPATTPGIVQPAMGSGQLGATGAKSLQEQTNELVDSLQEQIRYVGKTADETARLKLEAQGLSPEWLRVIGAMQQQLGAAQRTAEARAEVERMSEALREQLQTAQLAAAGWSTEQIERWRLAQRGATNDQLEQLAALQQQAAAVRAQQDAATAAANRQQTLRDALIETTKRLKEQADTAGMTAEQIELYRLQNLGATPAQLAQVAALQRQARGLQEVTKGQQSAIASAQQLQATTAGSADALDRVQAYRRMLAQAGPPVDKGGSPARSLVGPPIINETPPRRQAELASKDQNTVLLGRAVEFLQRIAVGTETEKIVVEQVG